MKKLLLITMLLGIGYSQCTPIEVSVYISEKDGWMFPYSTFYWGMSDGLSEIQQLNDECYQLLENNNECIMNCINMEQDELNNNLGRVGCIYYNCPDGELLIQDYETHTERPAHLYGELYCADNTDWNATSNLCQSNISIEDLNGDGYDDASYDAGAESGDPCYGVVCDDDPEMICICGECTYEDEQGDTGGGDCSYGDECFEAGAISGDLNLDGADNVQDVVILVNNILNP